MADGGKGRQVGRGLGEVESTIMERMWAIRRPASVRDVLEHLQQRRTILLKRRSAGRASIYEAVSSMRPTPPT
ncbi:hypothetical protein [Nonomuraea sp. GTA35]|uniref:hypothetical protein n=1 Tax=Nonomuraea sp. GTA35 TaxID=1676746 RepID=UPI0035C0CED5